MKEIRINHRIKSKEVRLIDAESKQVGVVSISEAIKMAEQSGFDLVEVAPDANPPVCRIMDFGKYKYQQSKKQSHKKAPEVKEIKVRPHIDEHDLELKTKNLIKFLENGHKIKVSMFFRGRERGRPELGMKVFDKINSLIIDVAQITQEPKFEGGNITMMLAPKSVKHEKGGKTDAKNQNP